MTGRTSVAAAVAGRMIRMRVSPVGPTGQTASSMCSSPSFTGCDFRSVRTLCASAGLSWLSGGPLKLSTNACVIGSSAMMISWFALMTSSMHLKGHHACPSVRPALLHRANGSTALPGTLGRYFPAGRARVGSGGEGSPEKEARDGLLVGELPGLVALLLEHSETSGMQLRQPPEPAHLRLSRNELGEDDVEALVIRATACSRSTSARSRSQLASKKGKKATT